ncbi:MAG: hypothetical protein GY922_12500, partial [Proteobacteria bacterium]|nr:hypothetical protein [Pseudomonadota bacterium]
MVEVFFVGVSVLALHALYQISARLFQLHECLIQTQKAGSENLGEVSFELERISQATANIPC